MFYFNPLASKNSLINGLRDFFLRSTREPLAQATVLAKIFLFIVKCFFLVRRKIYVFRASDRKSDRGSLSYSKLPANKLIISIWSNFLENTNSIEQLLSKIQRVERKCELDFDAHFHRMPLLLSFSFLRFYSSARLHCS